jgi:hypothetical protein
MFPESNRDDSAMTQALCHPHRPAMPLGWLKGRKHKPLGDLALASVLLVSFLLYMIKED